MELNGIRMAGCGKFSTIVDEYVWSVSLDGGADEECDMAGNYFCLLRHGHTIFRDHDSEHEELTEDERNLIVSSAGCIVSESSDGFVYVEYVADMAELDKKWASILEESDKYATD